MKKLSIILAVIGILVILGPVAGKMYTQYQEDRLIAEWLNSEDAESTETEAGVDPEEAFGQLGEVFEAGNGGQDTAGNTDTTAEVQETQSTQGTLASEAAVKSPSGQKVLGIIRIDKIKLKYPVVEGVKPENLRAGIGHIPGTAALGQLGNCALAGHRNYTFGRFFNRLDEVKVGDEIGISTKETDYAYRVYEKLVVKPDDVSVIKGGQDESVITLITCTPIYVATHRLIIHARLESQSVKQP